MKPKTILVTGAGRGLGQALTREALNRGYVVFATCRDPSAASGLIEMTGTEAGRRLHTVQMDMTDPASVAAAQKEIAGKAEALHCILANAGANLAPGFELPASRGPLAALEPDALAALFKINVLGNLNILQAFQPMLEVAIGATVICISSDRASIALAGRASIGYSISKTALNMLVKKIAPELEEAGIRIIAVHPGWMRTDMGGPTASVDPADAAFDILKLVESPDYPTGVFLRTDGTPLPW
ncbi:SDR family oxidoreductase [Pseudochelatococcus sp. B33]